jgi:hypothetical protein
MMLSGTALLLALALVAAPRAATKRKKSAAPAAAVEKRVAPPNRSERKPHRVRREPEAAKPAPSDHTDSAPAVGADVPLGPTTVKPAKTKVYTFGAMDVEGKLKTPQLLYFLNRVKLELEMSAPDHRSFMKELEKTADDPNL